MDKFIENLIKLKDYVPFFQTFLWIILLLVIAFVFRNFINLILSTIVERLRQGSSFKAGPLEVGEKLSKLDYIPQNETKIATSVNDREDHRVSIYKENRGLFLTHLIQPTDKSGQGWDIFIYLIRHQEKGTKDIGFSDIQKAEFFFGHMWGNQVYEEKVKHGIIGVKTSAYAPFLCTCFVTMKDGVEIRLNRYIDFEIEKIIKNTLPNRVGSR
jgi:hypothetical protein